VPDLRALEVFEPESALRSADELPEVAGGIGGEHVAVAVELDPSAPVAGLLERLDRLVERVAEPDGGVRAAGRAVAGIDREVDLGAVVGGEPPERSSCARLAGPSAGSMPSTRMPLALKLRNM
jgi:hypothetical protein